MNDLPPAFGVHLACPYIMLLINVYGGLSRDVTSFSVPARGLSVWTFLVKQNEVLSNVLRYLLYIVKLSCCGIMLILPTFSGALFLSICYFLFSLESKRMYAIAFSTQPSCTLQLVGHAHMIWFENCKVSLLYLKLLLWISYTFLKAEWWKLILFSMCSCNL